MRVQELEVTRRGLQQDNAALSLRYVVLLLSVRALSLILILLNHRLDA